MNGAGRNLGIWWSPSERRS